MADYTTTARINTVLNGEQAENALRKLQEEAHELKLALTKAYNAGDTKRIKQFEKELQNNRRSARQLQAGMIDVDKVLASLNTSSVRDLQKAIRQVKKELDTKTRGSDEYARLTGKLRELNSEMARVREGQKQAGDFFSAIGSRIAKVSFGITSFISVVTQASAAMERFIAASNSREESSANLKALTGLDDSSIEWLDAEAARLSTSMTEAGLRVRQSAQEILDAYTLVGSAKPELLSDKEALAAVTEQALTLSVAARMDLKEAVDAVTLSMNQYGASADDAARYTNVMAAGSKYGSAAVQSVTRAILNSGVAASSAGVPIEQLVGSIETLAEKGIKDEVAGTGLKKFFLTLQTGADETNPKVVGLSTALRNLAVQQLSATEIKKRFGEEGYNVASVLISEAEKVERYTRAVTGTGVATEQAAVNSATAAAKMAQLKNEMSEAGIALARELTPYVIKLGSGLKGVTVTITGLLRLFSEWLPLIISTGSAIALWTAKVHAATIKTQLLKLWNDRLVVSFKNLGKAMKDNPIGIVLTVVSALSGAVYKLVKEHDDLNDSMEEMNANLLSEKRGLDTLFEPLKKNTAGADERRALIEKINEQYGQYLPNLLSEKSSLDEINASYANILSSMRQKITLSAKENAVTDVTKTLVEKQGKNLQRMREALIDAFGESSTRPQEIIDDVVSRMENAKNPIAESGRIYIDILNEILKIDGLWNLTSVLQDQKLNIALKRYAFATRNAQEAMAEINARFDPLLKNLTGGESANQASIAKSDTGGAERADSLQTTRPGGTSDTYRAETDRIRAALLERTNALRQQRAEDLITEEDYTMAVKALTLESLQDTVNATRRRYGEDSVEYQEALRHMLDAEIEFDRLISQCGDKGAVSEIEREDMLQRQLKQIRERYGLTDRAAEMQQELDLLDALHAAKLVKEEEYLQMKKAIEERYGEEDRATSEAMSDAVIQGFSRVMGDMSSLSGALQQQEMAAVDARYDREIKRAGENRKLVARLEEQKEAEKAKIQAKYADVQMGLSLSQAIADAALAVIKAWQLPFPMNAIQAGVVAASTGIQVAAIVAQRNAAKSNYWTGGFTPDGDWDEPQGTVHSGEFVANRFAVRNPDVRRVLNVIDAAQRNNTVGSLTATDVSRAIDPSGYAAQMIVQTLPVPGGTDTRMAEAASRLADMLSRPITAVVAIEGRDGFEEQYTRYRNLKNNASWSHSK